MQKLKKILCFRSLHLISSSSWSHESVEEECWRTEQETDTPAQADGQDRVLLGSDGLGAHREHDCQVSEVKILWNCEDDYFHQEPDLLHQSITWTEFTIEENMSESCWTKKLLKNSEMKVILPISGHEDECVDGDIGSADDDGLVEATPQLSEVPGRGKSIVSSCEGNTEYQEQQIRNLRRQIYLKTKQRDDLKMLFFYDSSTYTKLDILRKLKII